MARRSTSHARRRFRRGDREYIWTATRFADEVFPSVAAGRNESLILVSDSMWERTAGFEKCILERLIITTVIAADVSNTYDKFFVPSIPFAVYKTDKDETPNGALSADDPNFLVDEDVLQHGYWNPNVSFGTTMAITSWRPDSTQLDINVKRKLDSSEVIALKWGTTSVNTPNGSWRYKLIARALVRLV